MQSQAGDLRQRKGPSTQMSPDPTENSSDTRKIPSSRRFYEDSPVPGARKRWNADETASQGSHGSKSSSINGGSRESSDGCGSLLAVAPTIAAEPGGGPRKAMSGEEVKKEEKKKKTILVRVVYGACMFSVFAGSVYAGHVWVCLLVMLIQMMLFRELVSVRYSAFFHTIEDQIPLFRTTQWMWFAVAIFYSYGDFLCDFLQSNAEMHPYMEVAQYLGTISFLLYSGTFCITISTLQRGYIKFQINQLCWTVVVLCLTVGQLKYVMHNIFNGLFWYVFPCCCVFVNDIMAYVCGNLWGRKFIHRPFLSFSPNKTWEGFIGGAFCTVVVAWYLSLFLAKYEWMICPTNEINLESAPVHCNPDPIFLPAVALFPSQMMEILPRNFVKLLPAVVEICQEKLDDNGLILTPCVSGHMRQSHHHFEFLWTNYVPIQMHSIILALFAALVAPFGGFLASAIKRAYGIKDFASLIPGHGGVMDRMDCQFIMALYTWVHYNAFVRLSTVSVPKLVYMFSLLSEEQKDEFLLAVVGKGRPKRIDTLFYD